MIGLLRKQHNNLHKLLVLATSMGLGILALFANTIPAYAMSQVVIGGQSDPIGGATNEYSSIQGGRTWTTTDYVGYQCISTAGTFSRLSVELSADPGTSPDEYTFTLLVNGADSNLHVHIVADNTTGIDTVNEVDVVAGDYIEFKCTAVSTPSATPSARWSIVFTGDTANESLILGNGQGDTSITAYHALSQGTPYGYTENRIYEIIPTAGTIKNLYVGILGTPGAGAYIYTLRLGNAANSYVVADTTLTCTITNPASSAHDTAHSIAVAAGDIVTLSCAPSSSPTNSSYFWAGVTFVADIDGESLILGTSADTITNSQTEYNYLNTGLNTDVWGTTEANFYQGGQAPDGNMVLKKFYGQQSGTSGSGGSGDAWDYTIMKTGDASTGLTMQILETAVTANDTAHTYTVAAYDRLHIQAVPTSAPTSRRFFWGLVCYISSFTADIANDPSTKDFGVVAASSTYYADGGAPNNPVQDGDCNFTITNNGSVCDIDIHGHSFTGGVGWTLTSNAPGSNEVRITTYYSGQNPASGIVVTTSDQEFYDNLAASGTIKWDLKLETGTFTDGTAKTGVITLTAVAPD